MKRFCTNCGNETDADTAFCDNCGTSINNVTIAESTGTSPVLDAAVDPDTEPPSALGRWLPQIAGATTIAIAIAIGGVWRGGELADFLLFLVLLSPVIAGGFVALANNDSAVSVVDRLNDWCAATDSALANSSSFWRKYLARTVLWPFKKVGNWTRSIQDPYWKSGVRVVSCGYLGFTFLFVTAVIVYAIIILAITNFADFLLLLVLLSPVIAGGSIALAKNESAVSAVDRLIDWFAAKDLALANSGGFWRKYLARTVLWPFKKLGDWTQSMQDPYWKSGVRVVSCGYLGFAFLFVSAVIIYTVVLVAITIAIVALVLYVLSEMSGSQGTSTYRRVGVHPANDADEAQSGSGFFGGEGTSREREGLLGNYTEHRDAEGKVVGESRDREGLLGEYTEHRDAEGKVAGESREREGFLGKYTEHRDAEGKVVGESREHEGFLGKYTEHRDAEGKVVGESREREGLLGKYTEYKSEKN